MLGTEDLPPETSPSDKNMLLTDNDLLLKESGISKLIFQCTVNRLCYPGRCGLVFVTRSDLESLGATRN